MERPIFKYEIVLELVNENTKASKEVTRIEYAYSPSDAFMQAVMMVSQTAGSCKINLIRLGPPQDDVIETMQELTKQIHRALTR